MLIGITKAEAKEHKLPIENETPEEYDQYWTFIQIKRKNYLLQLHPESYYCFSISEYTDSQNLDEAVTVEGPKFRAITNGSLRSKIQTVRSKAKSLVGHHTNDPLEIQSILNNIPWVFLKAQFPKEIAAKLNQRLS